jgi:nicotinamidase-related amidase
MKKSALLVIDYQNDLVHPQGIVATKLADTRLEKAQLLAPKIQKLMNGFNTLGGKIFSIQSDYDIENYNGYYKEKRAQKRYANTALTGTWGHELYNLVLPENSIILEKHYFDAFYETNLDELLKQNNIEQIFLCGVNADVCVTHTAIGGAWRGYHTYLIEDLTETVSQNKEQAVEYLARIVDVQLVQSEEVVSLLKG